jgi:hypothetical protein
MGPQMVIYGGRNHENFVWDDVWFLNTSVENPASPNSSYARPVASDWSWASQSTVTYDPVPPPATPLLLLTVAVLTVRCEQPTG